MTPPHATEAERSFEAYWKINAPSYGPILSWDKDNQKKEMVRQTWLAAFTQGAAQEREQIAQLVEHHVTGPGPIRQQLAMAIRQRGTSA